jgi:mitochondrial fission protein ELM1
VGGRDEKSHFWETEKTITHIRKLIDNTPEVSWTISSSPRTPEDTIQKLSALGNEKQNVSFFRSQETPPGWVESAYGKHDVVWVTADSISMIYEALSAGCRVGILPVRWKHPDNKFQRSIDTLVQNGFAVVATPDRLDCSPPKPPSLDEASRCAREILERWWPRRQNKIIKTQTVN